MSTAVLDRALHVGSGSSSASGMGVRPLRAHVHLFGEPVPGWKLENPLPISLEHDAAGGRFIASDDIFNVYGVGQSWDAAVSDYKVALVEFFEIIAEAQDRRSLELLEHLRAYLKRG